MHFDATSKARAGDFVDVTITDASAHYLIGREDAHVKTRGGDAYAAREAEAGPSPTMLGIPTIK